MTRLYGQITNFDFRSRHPGNSFTRIAEAYCPEERKFAPLFFFAADKNPMINNGFFLACSLLIQAILFLSMDRQIYIQLDISTILPSLTGEQTQVYDERRADNG
ncbi:MAG: hypothetical protein AB1442_13245 [Nitrospirota bacterium]